MEKNILGFLVSTDFLPDNESFLRSAATTYSEGQKKVKRTEELYTGRVHKGAKFYQRKERKIASWDFQ